MVFSAASNSLPSADEVDPTESAVMRSITASFAAFSRCGKEESSLSNRAASKRRRQSRAVVVVTAVGVHPEVVQDGVSGFLMDQDAAGLSAQSARPSAKWSSTPR